MLPKPLGHYSQSIVHNDTVYVSGQLPIDPENPGKRFNSIKDQTTQVLKNIEAILKSVGSDKNNILKATLYICDMDLFQQVNQAYASFFGEHKPARAVVPINDLPKGFLIEIDAIASIS
jgi:2-iminobutanoate/2-iminopropanoate deaminase